MQNAVALSRLHTQSKDQELSQEMLDDLFRTVRNRRMRFINRSILRYAAIALLLLVNGWMIWINFETSPVEPEYMAIEVPKGQRVHTTLKGGVEVWLGPHSTLQIPDKASSKDYIVKLDGEAFFSVPKGQQIPFVVETGPYNIQVRGTTFNVFSYSGSSLFETDLLTGKIEVSNRYQADEIIIMQPEDKVFSDGTRLIKTASDFANEEDRKNGIVTFQNKPLAEILKHLSLWYDIQFDIKNGIDEDMPISGKFSQSDDINNIMRALRGVHAFRFKETDQKRIEIY
ncbi:MAG: FecR family protein [Tannerellaceae bacterium]|nr:FecR family protein [Tannerellaceae bacterium]